MNFFLVWVFWAVVTAMSGFALWVVYLCFRDGRLMLEERRECRRLDRLVHERLVKAEVADREVAQLEAWWNLPFKQEA